ncbi:MAG: hypothetical protein ACP5QR_04925 [Rhizomicrobium sp.]
MGQGISNFGSQMGFLYQKELMQENMTKLASQLSYQNQYKLQGQQQQFQGAQLSKQLSSAQSIAQGQETSAQNVANIEATSRTAAAGIYAGSQEKIASENILAAGNHLTFGQDGQAVVVNTVNHTTTPLNGPDGNPIKIQNPEMYRFAASLYSYNSQQAMLINEETQASLSAAKAEMNDKASTLPAKMSLPAMDKSLKPYNDRMTAIEQEGQKRIQALNQQTTSLIQSIANGAFFSQGAPGSGSAPVSPSGRPPLSSFLRPGGTSAVPSGSGR